VNKARIKSVRPYSRYAEKDKMRLLWFPAFLLFLNGIIIASVRSSAQSLFYTSFSAPNQFAVNGNASVSNGVLQLTPFLPNQNGAIWYNRKLHIADGFSTTFTFRFPQNAQLGGSGISFVLQNHPLGTNAIGGEETDTGINGIDNSLRLSVRYAINNNPDGTGASINVRCWVANSPHSLLGSTYGYPTAFLNREHTITLNYRNGELEYRFDNDVYFNHVLYARVDLAAMLTLDEGKVYAGFTGATAEGNFTEQTITGWSFSSRPDVTVSGTVHLEECVDKAQDITFQFRPNDSSQPLTRTVRLNTDGSFQLDSIPRKSYQVWVKGPKWLAALKPLDCFEGGVPNWSIGLSGGDVNNDNYSDIVDLLTLVARYNTLQGSQLYHEAADLNCDDAVDILDLLLLIRNYNRIGAL
jgi:hypothetical protein